jgi:hypothetical protein
MREDDPFEEVRLVPKAEKKVEEKIEEQEKIDLPFNGKSHDFYGHLAKNPEIQKYYSKILAAAASGNIQELKFYAEKIENEMNPKQFIHGGGIVRKNPQQKKFQEAMAERNKEIVELNPDEIYQENV